MGYRGNKVVYVCIDDGTEFVYWDAVRCNGKRKCPRCHKKNYLTKPAYQKLVAAGQIKNGQLCIS